MDNINTQGEFKSESDEANSSFDLDSLDPEQRQKVEEELKTELIKVSSERLNLSTFLVKSTEQVVVSN